MISTVFFGTYTQRRSKGIYKASFDSETGQLSNLSLFASTENPAYLTFTDNDELVAVKQLGDQGGIAIFNHEAKEINNIIKKGAPLCHVCFDGNRQLVYGANYHEGEVSSYSFTADRKLHLEDCDVHRGNGPHPNQKSPHAHFVGLTPDQLLVNCDLGMDQLITYNITDEHKLEQINHYHATAGSGPRHLVFHPHQNFAYLLCELNSRIEVLSYQGQGQFKLIESLSTLPDGFSDFNATAAIRISSDGKFLYASNRGHNSIAIYAILDDGRLKEIEIVSSHGDIPRDFCLSPDEKFLIIVHQDSDNATIFSRNKSTGKLNLISDDFIVPESVCILFKN